MIHENRGCCLKSDSVTIGNRTMPQDRPRDLLLDHDHSSSSEPAVATFTLREPERNHIQRILTEEVATWDGPRHGSALAAVRSTANSRHKVSSHSHRSRYPSDVARSLKNNREQS